MLRTVVYLFVLVLAAVQGFVVAQRIALRAQQQVAALDALAVTNPARLAATTTTTATSADAMRAALGL